VVKRWLPIIIFLAILFVPGILLPRFGTGAVTASVSVRPEVLFTIGGIEISNTLLTSWIVVVLLTLFAFFSTRNMRLIPSGLQNVMEMIIEALDGLTTSVAGARGRKFFPIVTTIFLFVFFSNLLGLVPGFGPIGLIPVEPNAPPPQGISTFDLPPSLEHSLGAPEPNPEEGVLLAPLLRSPSSDINFTLALALISVVMTQIFGMQQLGAVRYWFTRFFLVEKIGKFFRSLLKGKPDFAAFFYGLIDIFVGLLEFISEIVKILSFTFRLFGNIFAGEVVLLIMAYLFFALPFVFYGLELFVGFMQAFVFAILTLVFMTIATTAHGAEEHH
jgi:F-type H+-transporting ATPase subunit a